jgi:hypothetical protein
LGSRALLAFDAHETEQVLWLDGTTRTVPTRDAQLGALMRCEERSAILSIAEWCGEFGKAYVKVHSKK